MSAKERKGDNQKLKMLFLVKIFSEETDERHYLTMPEIISRLSSYGVNADGFRVDVAQVDQIPKDMTVIRMNVDDFDEAYEYLTARGFKNTQGDKVTETDSSKSALMTSPSGFGISLSQHIQKNK